MSTLASRGSLAFMLSIALIAASIQSAAYGSVISTQQYLSAADRQATIARIDTLLARDEVRSELEHYGVDPAEASQRVAALSDQELSLLAERLDNLPAGGSLVAVVGVVFIVLLILELVGVIDIFKRF